MNRLLWLVLLLGWMAHAEGGPACFGWTHFNSFKETPGRERSERIWTSPVVRADRAFREIILSWNADLPPSTRAVFEAAPVEKHQPLRFYQLGWWSSVSGEGARRSVKHQSDADAEVKTDTLALRRETQEFQIRIRMFHLPDSMTSLPLRLLAVSLSSGRISGSRPLSPGAFASHEVEQTPYLCQLDYPGGEVWCSPTSVAMILQGWSRRLGRPELAVTVPRAAAEVYDPNWPGTGNWSLNMAYAGSFPKMRAYVIRLDGLDELLRWTSSGIPVAASVCYNRLREKEGPSSGHLVVCVGVDRDGRILVNDPGSRTQGRRAVAASTFLHAWAHSNYTVYLIHAEDAPVPTPLERRWLPR